MKRSFGSRKTASNLPESVLQRLNRLAIAAILAVGLLALTQPSEARIVYTPTNIRVGGSPINLDLNHDGLTDFTLEQRHDRNRYCYQGSFNADYLVDLPAQGNGVVVSATKGSDWAAALNGGTQVGHSQTFTFNSAMATVAEGFRRITCDYVHFMRGHWVNVSNRYLGLEFKIKGKTHYGWARLNVQVSYVYISATVTGFAYETIPGKSINAGHRKEATHDSTNEDFGPGSFLTNPIPNTPQPASPGVLARGVQGVPLRRRREESILEDESEVAV